MVREHLLINKASEAKFLPFKTGHQNAINAEETLGQAIRALGSFDPVILGMGGDGHTASLFPDSANLDKALDVTCARECIAVKPLDAPHQRMTMTLTRLLNSRRIFIHITGQRKKAVFDQAKIQNNALSFPITTVINQQETPVTLYFSP